MGMIERQHLFAVMAAKLILKAAEMGYQVTLGDCFRDDRCDYGAVNSKHKKRLAIDLNLFKDGKYLTETFDHQPLGLFWESIGGIWGGRFDDGNHYEWPDQ